MGMSVQVYMDFPVTLRWFRKGRGVEIKGGRESSRVGEEGGGERAEGGGRRKGKGMV